MKIFKFEWYFSLNWKCEMFTVYIVSLLMTILQIVSLYSKQLLQGSVNATLGRFCLIFCGEKKHCNKKLFNVSQSSCLGSRL